MQSGCAEHMPITRLFYVPKKRKGALSCALPSYERFGLLPDWTAGERHPGTSRVARSRQRFRRSLGRIGASEHALDASRFGVHVAHRRRRNVGLLHIDEVQEVIHLRALLTVVVLQRVTEL